MRKFVALLVVAALWLGTQSDAAAQMVYVAAYQPVTVYSTPASPCCPQTVYYAPAVPAYQPVVQYRTRYRPILGGTVTRVRYGYTPVYAAPVVYAY